MVTRYAWRGQFGNAELNELHAEAFGHAVVEDDWASQVDQHSLGWVCARDGDDLVGFVNVPWDGGVHAFILDTIVAVRARRRGVGTRLIAVAVENARPPGASGSTSTSRTSLPRSTSKPAGSRPRPPASSSSSDDALRRS